jgi:hypothetical protein
VDPQNMDSYKLAVKLFVENPSDLKTVDFIPVFHRWIQTRALDGHQLIDVADYGHVHQGPGTVLVSHEANIHADVEGGRLGLFYIRKYTIEGSFADRLKVVFTNALKAASLLEKEPALAGKIKFRTDEALFQINDRLNAPNTPQTFAEVKGDLNAFLQKLYGGASVELIYHPDPQRLFEVGIRASQAVPLGTLLDRAATV